MQGRKMITISLCMIVKNEADILARCLDTVCDLMDEIIIVDTGSNDGTKAIAARYTEKIYDFTWVHDFAAARNFAFAQASGDYIYSADADEVLDDENRQRFRELKQVLSEEVEIVQMFYANQLSFGTIYNYDRELRPKLFKRLRTFAWVEPIHETVRLEPVIFDSDIEIIHRPKGSHTARDIEAFERMIKKKEQLSKRLNNLYARELFVSGLDEDFRSAEAYFEEVAVNTDCTLGQIKEASCVVARAARLRKDYAKFFKFALKDVGSEGSSEICCELGYYYQERRDYHEAIVWFYNAAFETTSSLSLRCSGVIPLTALVECYRLLGMDKVADEYQEMIERIDRQ
ncbi:MAG: glycosyltransferase [Lachnospiraceae bacterium]|jgi:glycosyltransferase involved in cell wall biosynthesis|nr:glycosyltransferase [Lachnospiraceae bacterium]